MAMNPRLLRPRASGYDPAAQVYFNAVAVADGEGLEPAVKKAINDFITGCKADGVWTAIKASCLLMGARTLSGALTPLVGAAPTNINFVSGDYNRKTGLLGNTTKYIDTGRNRTADPQNSSHASCYVTSATTVQGFMRVLGVGDGTGRSLILNSHSGSANVIHVHGASTDTTTNTGGLANFCGVSRSVSGSYTYRINSATGTVSQSSQSRPNLNWYVFSSNPSYTPTRNRMSFYSIGEAVDLALLDSRVSTLYTAIGAAIP